MTKTTKLRLRQKAKNTKRHFASAYRGNATATRHNGKKYVSECLSSAWGGDRDGHIYLMDIFFNSLYNGTKERDYSSYFHEHLFVWLRFHTLTMFTAAGEVGH